MDYKEALAFYDELVAANPKFERLGKTMPYTGANTYMFSLLNKDAQLGIRLPDDLRAEFHEKYCAEPYRSYGAVMRDYVLIPESLLEQPAIIGHYLDAAYEYVMSLPPQERKGKK